jgi:predicted NAD/FAD-dependent oxidoreductase
MARIAVIGAGLAGLTVARELSRDNEVTVFEKSRGAGGRISTRYAAGCEFDHGAQFFVAKSQAFQTFLQPLIEQGVVCNWQARFAELERGNVVSARQWGAAYPHYVGAPRMNAIGKWLARDVNVRLQTEIVRLDRRHGLWRLVDSEGSESGPFDWVVMSAPASQTAAMLPPSTPMHHRSATVRMNACCALMLAFDEHRELPFDAALVRGTDISWISVNSSKPGRSRRLCLVVHSTNAWADRHIDDGDDAILAHLLAECSDVIGIEADSAAFCGLQRWRYANLGKQPAPHCLIDEENQLAACGDWLIRGRIEAAFSSAMELLEALKRTGL